MLDASRTADPDRDDLNFTWSVYPTDPKVVAQVVIEGRTKRIARFIPAPKMAGKTVPILLSVSDKVHPSLTRYARLLVTIPVSK